MLLQAAGDLVHLADAVDHVHRDADRAALVGDGAGDRLPDPPGGIGGEAEAAAVIIFLDGFHQSQVAFLDQVEEGDAAPEIFLGDADHQAGVGLDQVVAGINPVLNGLLEEGFLLLRGGAVELGKGAFSFEAASIQRARMTSCSVFRRGTRDISLR